MKLVATASLPLLEARHFHDETSMLQVSSSLSRDLAGGNKVAAASDVGDHDLSRILVGTLFIIFFFYLETK